MSTAIHRKGPSAPCRWLYKHGYICNGYIDPATMRERAGLDYGCGHGADCDFLGWLGWDPVHRRAGAYLVDAQFRAVTCTYVLNVIRGKGRRAGILRHLDHITEQGGDIFVTVRRDLKVPSQNTSRGYQVDVPDHELTNSGYTKIRETAGYPYSGG